MASARLDATPAEGRCRGTRKKIHGGKRARLDRIAERRASAMRLVESESVRGGCRIDESCTHQRLLCLTIRGSEARTAPIRAHSTAGVGLRARILLREHKSSACLSSAIAVGTGVKRMASTSGRSHARYCAANASKGEQHHVDGDHEPRGTLLSP
eukprot:1754655-Prymnesium_polylepis.1